MRGLEALQRAAHEEEVKMRQTENDEIKRVG